MKTPINLEFIGVSSISFILKEMHLMGIEPTHPAPEAGALSTELQMQVVLYFHLTVLAIPFFQKIPCPAPAEQKWETVAEKHVESGR